MTLKEIDESLPNGFHDSKIFNLFIDYENRVVKMELSIWIGEMSKNDAEREKHRLATLELSGLQYFVMESPDENYKYSKSHPIFVDMAKPKELPILPTNISKDSFVESFYVYDWNSFIHLAALEAKFTWAE